MSLYTQNQGQLNGSGERYRVNCKQNIRKTSHVRFTHPRAASINTAALRNISLAYTKLDTVSIAKLLNVPFAVFSFFCGLQAAPFMFQKFSSLFVVPNLIRNFSSKLLPYRNGVRFKLE